MKRNPALYRYNWAWFLAGLLLFGITADLIWGAGSRYLWGAIGGVLFMIIGGLRAKRREPDEPDEQTDSSRPQ
jgi:hypothetical protein